MKSLFRKFRLYCVCILLVASAAHAQVAPRAASSLLDRVSPPAGYVATTAPVALESVATEVSEALMADVNAFKSTHGAKWKFYVDRRSGGMALVEGGGIQWASATDHRLSPLAKQALDMVSRYPSFFQTSASNLVLDTRGSVNLGEQKQLWNIVFNQTINGVPVDGARVVFRVAAGKLVQFGVDRVIPAAALANSPTAPTITAPEAKQILAAYVGGFSASDKFSENGVQLWVPRGTGDTVGYDGPVGAGWTPVLTYRYTFTRPGETNSWQALVDARSGKVTRFVDATDYASLVKAGVYNYTNCTDVLNCQPGTATEVPVTMPFARLTFAGGTCTGDNCYSNSAGAFSYPSGAASGTVNLAGKFFQIVDTCGAITAGGIAGSNIDLGTTLPSTPNNTDCTPATTESTPPNTASVFGGAGDTHAARNTYYHLNLIGQKARAYLPGNEWLKGVDGSVAAPIIVTSNIAPACNAFWQGGTGTLNFERVTAALFCNNTGDLPDVFLHEFGHGLDQNDATGTAPESATGEAMGDTFALLQGQHSCIGVGFRLQDPTDVNWGNRAGYGTGSALCTGVRDIDYTRFCYHTTLAGCAATTLDPDAPHGSRSGLTPNLNAADAGTPAKWSTMIKTAPVGIADGQSNFYNCSGPETTGCAGPLHHGCHCESQIASQSNWDLAKELIKTEFGGNPYATPQGPLEVSGWQYMDRLWYLTRDLAVSAYSVTGVAPTGTTNGCGIDNWFSTYRFVDDDDADLSNGTPHAAIIYAAFNKHETACGLSTDASNQSSGCGAPLAAPVLSACEAKAPVQLNWTASAGATTYRILRNTLGAGFGFTPIGTVSGSKLYYEDADVAPGVTYYYTVQPVGNSASCYGFASNAVAVTPAPCDPSTVPTPQNVTATTPASNQIAVSWNPVASAASYKIYRKAGNCSSTNAFTAIGVVNAPITTFVDADGLQGTYAYSYQVAAADSTCASCTSAPSSCVSAVATGSCAVRPTFAGVKNVVAAPQGSCLLTVNWDAGTSGCGPTLFYNVYRSTDPNFVPAASNLLVGGIATTSYADAQVVGGIRYYYVVRAIDAFGNSEDNVVKRNEVAIGSLTPGTLSDNAGDTGTPFFTPSTTLGNQWAIRSSAPGNATKVYATTPAGNYPSNACEGLESYTIHLGASPALNFRASYEMETGWDGGYVEVSTEAGGFTDWTKLDTVNYPAVMGGPLGSPQCGGDGFADGAPVFTGTSGGTWMNFNGSLSAYANQNIRLRFLFSSDGSTEQGGWLLDDINVTGALLAGSCVGTPVVARGFDIDPAGNRVLEPGESAALSTHWRNVSGTAIPLTGTISNFTGAGSSTYTITDSSADYGTLNDLQTSDCASNCYGVSVSAAARPAMHWDATFDEALSSGTNKTWSLHIGNSFSDVPTGNAFYRFIETIVHHNVTLGCAAGSYCPTQLTQRGQMAAFIARSMAGGDQGVPASGTIAGRGAYNCAVNGTSLFNDVPATSSFCRHIHYILGQNVTAGCAAGQFCPSDTTTRGQMAFFLSRVLVAPNGDAGVPSSVRIDASTGLNAYGYAREYDCNGSGSPAFSDVPLNDPSCKQIYYLWSRGIVDGFGDGTYKPTLTIPREQMSKFVVNTFKLDLHNP